MKYFISFGLDDVRLNNFLCNAGVSDQYLNYKSKRTISFRNHSIRLVDVSLYQALPIII